MRERFIESIVLVISLLLFNSTIGHAETPPLRKYIPNIVKPGYYFRKPAGMAFDSSSNLYILDTGNNCIKKFDRSGNLLTTIGAKGSGNGQFNNPTGFALDSDDNIYVFDAGNWRIQKLNQSGDYLSQIKSAFGTYSESKDGIAVDSKKNIYFNNGQTIKKYGPDGTFITSWGSWGTADGQFEGLSDLAVDGDDHIYAVENNNNRVQVFLADGTFVRKWGSSGYSQGQFNNAQAITVDKNGYVYVLDSGRIQKFTSTGIFVSIIGSYPDCYYGAVNEPSAAAVDPDGKIYVADNQNNRIEIFSPNGTFVTVWGSGGTSASQFYFSSELFSGISVDSKGYIYVADSANNRVQKFRADGNFVSMWGSHGTGNGQFNIPSGIATDSTGKVYVADMLDNRIEIFSQNGSFLKSFGNWGTGAGQFEYPTGLTIDDQDNLYVANYYSHVIQVFDVSGKYLTGWGGYGSVDGKMKNPFGIAADNHGFIYVADSGNQRIQKFTTAGAHVATWAGTSATLSAPHKMAADSTGNIYLANSNNNQIVKFSPDGAVVLKFGSKGHGDGQFETPYAVTVDAENSIYIADTGNNRIQKFDSKGNYLLQWGGWTDFLHVSDDGNVNNPTGISANPDGSIWVADENNSRIQIFSKNGAYLGKMGTCGADALTDCPWCCQYLQPYDVFIDKNGDHFITDISNNRISKGPICERSVSSCADTFISVPNPRSVTRDDLGNFYIVKYYTHTIAKYNSSGQFLFEWGKENTVSGNEIYPEGIVFANNLVYVSDYINNSIYVFTADGNYVKNFWGHGVFNSPMGIAIDSESNIYVTDSTRNVTIMLDSNGQYLAEWGSQGSGDYQFQRPTGIGINASGSFCVVDSENNRIGLFGGSSGQIPSPVAPMMMLLK